MPRLVRQTLSRIEPINHRTVNIKRSLLTIKMAALIGRGGTFLTLLNADINELNRLIEQYNQPDKALNRLDNLTKISKKKKEIEDKYPSNLLSQFPDYQSQIQGTLFSQLQSHFKDVGVLSFLLDVYSDGTANPNQPVGTLTELLANMAPEKISNLMKHLSSKPAPNALKNPYRRDESGYPAFQTLIDTHAFSFLGGGNSSNYKIINRATLEVVVLKVEGRLGQPRDTEAKLRAGVLQNILTPVAVERHATFLDASGDPVAKTLIVTNYCTGGDLYHHSHHQLDANVRLASTLDIYSQMATVLNTLGAAGYLFSDMKNPNWLLTQDGKLHIADAKAFLPIRGGVYNPQNVENKWYYFIHTNCMNPSEFGSPQFSADKAHAYMLGFNMYGYLIQATQTALNHLKADALKADTSASFSHAIFSSEEGLALKILINNLIQSDPSSRPSVHEALTELVRIQQISIIIIADLKIACNQLLLKIGTQNLHPSDAVLMWIEGVADRIKALQNSTQLRELQAEIQAHLTHRSMIVKKKPPPLAQQLMEALLKLKKPAKQTTPDVSSSFNPLKPNK